MRRGGALLGSGLLVILVAAAAVWWVQASRFDAERWRAGAMVQGSAAPRIGMVGDLMRRHDLVGMPQTEAVDLLGEPDETNYFADHDLVYWLGPERGLVSLDSEWLVLKLDLAGVIMEARVLTD